MPSRNRDLHRLQIPVRLETVHKGLKLNAYVAPGVATSSNVFKEIINRGSSDDLYLSGGFEARRLTGTRSWILGAGFDRSFGYSRLYPIIGLNLRPREWLTFRLAYPESRIAYARGAGSQLEWRLFPAGHEWHVRTDDFSDEFDYGARAWRMQLTWSVRAWRSLGLDLGGGYEFDRKHRFEDDNAAIVSGKVASEWFLNVGFRVGDVRPAYGHGGGL